MRTLFLSLSVWALAGCGGSTAFIDGADACDQPVLIPERWLSDQEVELMWARDRRALLDCGDKVEVLSGRKPR